MKKKIKKLLLKIRESKFFKIFFSTFLIFGVLLSCVVVPSSAAEDSQVSVPTDLTGYRIDVPSGWTCYSGYGVFDLSYGYYYSASGTYDDSYMYNQFAIGLSPSTSSASPNSFGLMANRVCGRYSAGGRYGGTRNASGPISLLVSGGSDSSNSTLIQWFVDNNASFTLINPPSQPSVPSIDDSIYQSIAPISFSDFSGTATAVAFPGPHSISLKVNADNGRTYLGNSDYHEYSDIIKTMVINDESVPYVQIYFKCNYPSVSRNGVYYSGSLSSNTITDTLSGVTSFEVYPVEHSYDPDTLYYYTWNILLGDFFTYDSVYNQGFVAGVESSEARDKYYSEGYDVGLQDGLQSSASSSLGSNLLGDTLSAPMRALNSFVLYTTPSGVSISLGLVLGSAISLTLFIAFLKLFAGG